MLIRRGQVGRSAGLGQPPLPLQLLRDGQQVDRQTLVVQAGEGLPDPAIAVQEEIVGDEEVGDVVVDLGVDQDRPQDGLFGLPGKCAGSAQGAVVRSPVEWRKEGVSVIADQSCCQSLGRDAPDLLGGLGRPGEGPR